MIPDTRSPRVSVIVLTLNSGRFIRRCLESLSRQTYREFEVIVVDAGSTDDTEARVRQFSPDIRWLSLPNSDMGAARNHGIASARGEMVTFLDSDDLYLGAKLERQAGFLAANPDIALCFCAAWHFRTGAPHLGGIKRVSGRSEVDAAFFLSGRNHNLNTMMMRRGAWESGTRFGEGDLGRYGEEWRLQLGACVRGVRMATLNEPLVVVEIRPDSHTTWDKQAKMKEMALLEIQRTLPQLPQEVRRGIDEEALLSGFQFRLAIAHLVAGSRGEARKTLTRVKGSKALTGYSLLFLSCLMPASTLRALLQRLWIRRQDQTFTWVRFPQGVRGELQEILANPR